jgi:ankyrin repeat protein
MQYVTKDSVLKDNALSHHVNTAKKVVKLSGIWKYAAQGDVSKLTRAMAKESPHVENEEKRTPLQYAAENGHINAVNALLTGGANINHRDMRGDTAIHCALRAKREDMALFLVGKGCDMSIANTASITGWELAEKISKRFYIQLRENTKCSNPSASSSSAAKPKPVAAPVAGTQYNAMLNQVILYFGQYVMSLRGVPAPGSEQPAARTPPFPATPFDGLKIIHARLHGYASELALAANKDLSNSPSYRGSCTNLKDHIARQTEHTKTPITDLHIFNSLHTDLFNITNSGIDLLSQFEESLVTRAFTSHVEKFTGSVRAAHESADKWEPSEFIIDFAKLNRNVLVQLLYIGDPERSKNISDGLQLLSKSVHSFVAAKKAPAPVRAGPVSSNAGLFMPSIADNLRKIHVTLSQSSASSALFPDEEKEVFDSAIKSFEEILALSLTFGVKRSIQIILSELVYIKEAAFASPTNRDVLLNCALFIHCTCSRIAKMHTDKKAKEPIKTVVDHIAGLLTLCGNMTLLVACAIVTKNRNYHYVHMGYAIRAVATATTLLADPAYGISTHLAQLQV